MKILHTADWHLGKTLCGVSLHEDQAYILDQIFDAIVTEHVDVLVVAGDVYDRASPSEAAIRLYSDFLERVYGETAAAIVVIAGNHDSGQRLGAAAKLYDNNRVLIRGSLERDALALVLEDAHGPVAFSGLPYGEIHAARQALGNDNIKTPEDVLRCQIDAARARVPGGARWVIVAHAFITDCQPCESERRLAVGSVETVPASLFDGADYVALGHLHRPQTAASETIRYSGSPLAFGFDEAGMTKSMTVFELGAGGHVRDLRTLAFAPLRKVREVRGHLADLVAAARADPSADYIRAILLDEGALVEPAAQLRPFYPNILQTLREKRRQPAADTAGRARSGLNDPLAVIEEFVAFVRGDRPDDGERNVINEILVDCSRQKGPL